MKRMIFCLMAMMDMLRKRDADFDKKSDIKWNFTKFLVGRNGRVLKRYEPTDKINAIEADIQMEVNPVLSSPTPSPAMLRR